MVAEHVASAHEGFQAVLRELEPAKAALTDVVPGSRIPGRPLHHALEEFEHRLERARSLMPGWRCDELAVEWEACEAGLATASSSARRIGSEAHRIEGFEGLLGAVSSLLDPLEPFADAEESFRALRISR